MKKCMCCGEMKPATEFYQSKATLSGLRAECKECSKGKAAQWKADNPEKAREMSRKWKADNPEKAREIARRWKQSENGQASEAKYREKCKLFHELRTDPAFILSPAMIRKLQVSMPIISPSS